MRRILDGVVGVAMSFVPILSGCAGHFVVKPTTPNSTAPGFRYYLPKPFLLVTNMSVAADEPNSAQAKPSGSSDPSSSSGSGKVKDSSTSAKDTPAKEAVVTVKIILLPDTATPYTITTSGAGLGTFKGGLQLTNGWMLTNVNEESDAKVAETLTAVSGLVGAVLSPGSGKTNKGLGVEGATATPFLYLFEIDPSNHKLTRVDTSPLNDVLTNLKVKSDSGTPIEK